MKFTIETKTLKNAIDLAGKAISPDKAMYDMMAENIEFQINKDTMSIRTFDGACGIYQFNIPIMEVVLNNNVFLRFVIQYKVLQQFLRIQMNEYITFSQPNLAENILNISGSGKLRMQFVTAPSQIEDPILNIEDQVPEIKLYNLPQSELLKQMNSVKDCVSKKNQNRIIYEGIFLYNNLVIGMSSTHGLFVPGFDLCLDHGIPPNVINIIGKLEDDSNLMIGFDDSKIFIIGNNVIASHVYLEQAPSMEGIFRISDKWKNDIIEDDVMLIKFKIDDPSLFIEEVLTIKGFIQNDWLDFKFENDFLCLTTNNERDKTSTNEYSTVISCEYDIDKLEGRSLSVDINKLMPFIRFLKNRNDNTITFHAYHDNEKIKGPLVSQSIDYLFFSALGDV